MKNKCVYLLGLVLTAGLVFAAESAESLMQKLGGKTPTDSSSAVEINGRYVVSSVSLEERGLCFSISRGYDKVWYKSSSKDVLCQQEYYVEAPRGISVTVKQVSRQTDAKGIVVFSPEELGLELYPPRKVSIPLSISGNGITSSFEVEFHSLSNPVDAGLYAIALNEATGLRARQTALLRLKKRHFLTDGQYSAFLGNLYQDEPLPLEVPGEVEDLVKGRVEDTADNAPSDDWEMTAEEITFDLPGGTKLTMRRIPAGQFSMGSPTSESGRDDDEVPHRVTISRGFWLGKFEVTQAQWQAVMGDNPSHFKNGGDYPVERVSWEEAKRFCERLNGNQSIQKPAGYRFDLPTEAQWEYACRAGTATSLNNGQNMWILGANNSPNLDELGWYGGNCGQDFHGSVSYNISSMSEKQYNDSRGGSHPVGKKKPNAWGLYDMHGNVLEWCRDWYGDYPSGSVTDPTGPSSGSNRVHRGGSWNDDARGCRSACRYDSSPSFRCSLLGFRLALVPVQ
jgi:formylglycine-generating enzyme required for sulfatase activity